MNFAFRLGGRGVCFGFGACLSTLTLSFLSPTHRWKYSYCASPSLPPSSAAAAPLASWDDNWDGRANQPAKVSRQIVLIRHGQYIPGESDHERVLSALGREQAVCTGKRLRQLLDAKFIHEIDHVYYSTMNRAEETFREILPLLPTLEKYQIEPCSMIREGAVARPIPSHSSWKPTETEFKTEGKRVDAAFFSYFHRANENETKHKSTIFVCHGNVIRYFVMRALQLPPEAWLRTSVLNASITIINISADGSCSVRCFSDGGHFPPNLLTYN